MVLRTVMIISGENAVLHYIIPNGIADGKFAISSFTGEITTTATLDREFRDNWVITGKSYELIKISKIINRVHTILKLTFFLIYCHTNKNKIFSSNEFVAYVKDSAFPSLYDTTTVIVHITDKNDNAPAFKNRIYRLEVPENTKLTVVHTVVAMDLDSGNNGRITYSIVGK